MDQSDITGFYRDIHQIFYSEKKNNPKQKQIINQKLSKKRER